jgi:hypothetical protein
VNGSNYEKLVLTYRTLKKSVFAIVTLLFMPMLATAAPDWTVGLRELDLGG